MTMLQIHAEALESVSAAYHEFLLRYKANAKSVYGIVEGKEDPMFYKGLIERNLPEGWEVELVPAGCKDNVIKSITAFDWTRFSRKRVCFFADRDLSGFVTEASVTVENLYVTDNYSIENDAVNFGALKRLLEEVLNINDLKPQETDNIRQLFDDGLSMFREAMLPIMAQIVQWQRNGQQPCLNNIRPKELFIFVDGKISLKTEFELVSSRLEYAAKCVNIHPSSLGELSNVEWEFRQKQGIERFIRGKYLLSFMVEFALEIHRSISAIISRFATSPKLRISFGEKNAMIFIAPRVRCPVSLQTFLDQTYGQYIKDSINAHTSTSTMTLPVGA